MKPDNIYPEPGEELKLLTLELSEVKNILREVSQQILRVERRVRVALPSPQKPPGSNGLKRLDKSAVSSTISQLTERAKKGEQIENELRGMTVKNGLAMLARELGMTNTKLPPKDELIRRIATRIRQRAHVVYGIREAVGVREDSKPIS